jgi:hypothetical protein
MATTRKKRRTEIFSDFSHEQSCVCQDWADQMAADGWSIELFAWCKIAQQWTVIAKKEVDDGRR